MTAALQSGNRLFGFSALLVLSSFGPQDAGQDPLRVFLIESVGFSEADLASVDSGRVATHYLPGGDDREIGVFAVVRLEVPGAFAVEQVSRPELFGLSSAVPAIGRFSDPPRLSDVADLTFPREDLKALRECRVGACDVKLSAEVIERFLREVDWEAEGGLDEAADLARRMLVDYVASYMEGGDSALGSYADKEEVLSIAEGFAALLESASQFAEAVPELHAYMADYPNARLPNSEDIIYWTREDFGLKPVVSLYHSTVYSPAGSGASQRVIAQKQIYASHYFHAALGVMTVVGSAGVEGKQVAYLLYARRARFDGELRGFRRIIVRSRLSDKTSSHLGLIRDRLEEAYRNGLSVEDGIN